MLIISAAAVATAIQTKTVRLSVVSREKTEADNNIIIVSWRCSARGVSRRTKTTGKFAPGQPRWWQSSVLFLFPVHRHRVYSEYIAENREIARRRCWMRRPARIINKNDRGPEKFFDRARGGEMQHFCCSCTPVRDTALYYTYIHPTTTSRSRCTTVLPATHPSTASRIPYHADAWW